jgi:hypothetical protein
MARFYYYVVNSGTRWEVTFDGQGGDRQYIYQTQQDAISAAVNAAHAYHERGELTGVRVQGANGQWRDERTYGNDPSSPRG